MSILEWFGAKPTMKSFAGRLLRALEAAGPRGWVWDSNENVIRRGDECVVNLANLYREYAAAPRAARSLLLAKYASIGTAMASEPPKLWAVAKKNVFPVVRSKYDASQVEIAGRGRDVAQNSYQRASFPWLGDLVVKHVYDFGDFLAPVSDELLETWGQTPEALHEQALQNLAALEQPTWKRQDGGVHALHSDVSYTESMLLLGKVLDRLPFAGSLVCTPCNRGMLLAADAQDAAAVAALITEAMRAAQENPWPQTATLCHRREDGTWDEFWPKSDTDLAAYASLRNVHLAMAYDAQKSALEALHERTGEDVFVAPFTLMGKRDGNAISWCTWVEGVKSLLPAADYVVFGRKDMDETKPPVFVDWSTVMNTCAGRIEATAESPVRMLVDSFPDDREWALLQEAAGRFRANIRI